MGYFSLEPLGVPKMSFIGRQHDRVDSRFDEVWKSFKTLGEKTSGFNFAIIPLLQMN